MSIRRGWTAEEDKVLKMLKQERNIKKWSSIAKIMDYQFNMCGRNGKQCRQRYNNHLEEGIIEEKFNLEDQRLLERLNHQIGNKWSVISRAFKGRTANFLKNQLYSKLRKAIRKLNKFIKDKRLKSVRQFKLNVVFKIVQSNDFKIFEKERHSAQDLKFYSELREKLFRFAEESTSSLNDIGSRKNQIETANRQLIEQLLLFSRKYQHVSKKVKKPRKKYFCQDDIILNSLSNNRTENQLVVKNTQSLPHDQNSNDQELSESDSDSQNSMILKKPTHPIIPETNRIQLQMVHSIQRPESEKKNKSFEKYEKNSDQAEKYQSFSRKDIHQLQKAANENCKIVEEGEMDHASRGYRLLQQSQQCQFMDVQYLEHFKSCSLIDQSLFQ